MSLQEFLVVNLRPSIKSLQAGFIRRLLALVLLAGFQLVATAQVCAPPSLLVTTIPAGGIINDYYPGSGTPNLNSNVSSFTLGTRDTRGYTSTLVIGDLLMVMQMQDGTINSSNNSNYGDGSGVGSGSTSVGKAGLYEFVRITAVTGLNVTVTPALTNSYVNAAASATTSQKRYQVVRVLQFSSVNTNSGGAVTTPPWNGDTGGVVAMDVRDTLTLGGLTIEGQTNRAIYAAGKGFRGGRAIASGTDGTAAITGDYAVASTVQYHASKGEGIIGTPLYMAVKTGNWSFKATNPVTTTSLTLGTATAAGGFEGYPGGSYARGAPGNAGGGGVDSDANGSNSNNAGGGGGGNYGQGGIGGRPWASPLLDLGGRGGASYAGTLAFNRIFMGGGGGAGGTNNSTADAATYTNNGISCSWNTGGICSSAAAGGGVIVVRARQVAGTGVIDARGANGYNVINDAGGGAGAGGSVIIETPNGGSAVVDVSGGDGGNANASNATWTGERHGPGGAGGGGFVAYAPNTMAVSASYNGGAPGETTAASTDPAKPVPEYYGSMGFNGGITTFQSPNVPGVPQAALCDPNLSLAKSDGVTSLTSPGTNTYTFTITNSGNGASFGTITLADQLPAGLSVTPGTLTLGGPNAASFTCVAANATDISCTSNVSVAGSGGTRVFSISTTVNGTNGTSIVNRAIVAGGGDPNKTTAATPALAAACTANNTPAGCALDTDTIVAPNLTLTKTDGTTTVARGGTVVYSLTVTNGGGSTTVGTITVADVLPTGLTYSGAAPFTVNNFTCAVSGQGITCNRTATLAISASALITFTAVVGNSAPSSLINLAKVGGGGDPSPGKSTRPTTATAALCPSPTAPANTSSDPDTGCASDVDAVLYVDLQLTKDDGQAFVNSGGTTDYLFVVSNIGTAPTTGQINFGDVIPGNTMTFVATGTFTPTGVNGSDWSCTRSAASTTFCVSSVSIPAGGSSSFILRANIGAATVGTQQINRARVGGGGDVSVGSINSPTTADITACVGNGNPVGCATDLNTVQASAEIRMSKSHPDPQIRTVGDVFLFTLTIRNASATNSGGANTIQMIDVVPPNLTIGTVTANSPFTCTTALQVITCNNTVGALNGNLSRTITVSVTVASTATNSLINRAQVGTNGADPQNNVFPTTATVAICSGTDTPAFGCAVDPVPLNANLQIIKDQRLGQSGAFQTTLLGVAVGDVVQYRLQIGNVSGATVSTVTFSDPVPFYVSVNGSSTITLAGSATGCSVAFTGNQLNGTVTSLPAGGTCTVIIQGTATTASAGATNTAVVAVPSGINDTVPGNNTSTVLTAIGNANLSVAKTGAASTVTAGSTTSYSIVVTNAGPSPANGARIYDPVVQGLSCTAAPVCVASGAATCPAGLTMAQLQNTTAPLGVAIPTFGSGGSLTITVTCGVTATGQ